KSQRIKLLQVDCGQRLAGAAGIELIEGIVGALHTAVEEIAGVGRLAIVGDLGVATVQRKICGWGGGTALEEARPNPGEAEKIENVRSRTIRDTSHRMG